VTRPLLNVQDIRERSAAVEDLLRLSGPGSTVMEVETLMKKLPGGYFEKIFFMHE
jgi:hypothetical protein